LGIYSQGLVTVALYDTLGKSAVEYIINHAETKVAFCSSAKVGQMLSILPECKQLRYIIQYDVHPEFGHASDAIDEANIKKASDLGVQLIPYSELLARGKNSGRQPEPPRPDELAFIMYTSGTTGVPKGAMLRHGHVMACVGGVFHVVELLQNDSHISFLPLAHIFETAVQSALMGVGASVGFFSGFVKTLVEDIKVLKPTVFCGVPRVFTRMYDTIMGKLKALPAIKRLVLCFLFFCLSFQFFFFSFFFNSRADYVILCKKNCEQMRHHGRFDRSVQTCTSW